MPRHYYGWRPSLPDRRDLRYHPPLAVMAALPPAVDLAPRLGPVLDQGALGSCGPNSADGNIMYDEATQGMAVVSASRLFIYYATRSIMGTVGQDSGVDNRSMMKALNQVGFCAEALWPYDVGRFTEKPPQACFDAAAGNRIDSYAAVNQQLDVMRGTLAAGHTFVFGFTVYESFESAAVAHTGDVPMPGSSEAVLGGHDILFYGYDDAAQRFKFRNSWGPGWGAGGNGTMPYAYATDPRLSGDFWVINAVPAVTPTPPGPAPTPPPGPTPGPVPVNVLDWPNLRPGQTFRGRASSAVAAGRYGLVPVATAGGVPEPPAVTAGAVGRRRKKGHGSNGSR